MSKYQYKNNYSADNNYLAIKLMNTKKKKNADHYMHHKFYSLYFSLPDLSSVLFLLVPSTFIFLQFLPHERPQFCLG